MYASTFTSAALAILFAFTAVAAPVADDDVALEKRQHYKHEVVVNGGHNYVVTTTTVKPHHTVTAFSAVDPTDIPEIPTYASDSSSSSNSAPNSDAQTMLDAHNNYRSLHGAPPLSWNDDLASYAQSHASSCVFEHTGGNSLSGKLYLTL